MCVYIYIERERESYNYIYNCTYAPSTKWRPEMVSATGVETTALAGA